MAAILADATSGAQTLPWSMPGSCQSAAYAATRDLVDEVVVRRALPDDPERLLAGRGLGVSHGRRVPHRGLRGVFLDRVQDLGVAGAAAQIADQRPADPLPARPWVALQQAQAVSSMPGVQKPHCAAPLRRKHRLQRVETSPPGDRPRTVSSEWPSACTAATGRH